MKQKRNYVTPKIVCSFYSWNQDVLTVSALNYKKDDNDRIFGEIDW